MPLPFHHAIATGASRPGTAKAMKAQKFQWWLRRILAALRLVDIIRIDHFRGFESYWAVKQGQTTAMHGEWIKAPGEEFFQVLNDKLGKLPIMAEDLGIRSLLCH